MSDLENRDFPVNIEDIMHTAYLQYSLSVNVGRAIPDVRDGLKPVNRRILYAMKQLNLGKSHPTVKCARVVAGTRRFTTPWCGLPRIFPCGVR